MIYRYLIRIFLQLFTLFSVFSGSAQVVTLDKLIQEMGSRKQLSYFPASEYTLRQFSSYNRASIAPDKAGWYANEDMSNFIRVENNYGRREFVIFDSKGPGVVVRWWMTFFRAQDGIIRVYLDNDSMPVIQGSPAELLSGKMLTEPPFAASVQKGTPLGEQGRDIDHNFYLPIPFSKHCKITYECDLLTLLSPGHYSPDVFYNINYREYLPGVKVETFSIKNLSHARSLLEEAKKKLLGDDVSSTTIKKFEQRIAPGKSYSIRFDQKKSAINQLSLEVNASDTFQSLRSTVLSATFDGTETIWTPVGDFFGTAYEIHPHKTWMNEVAQKGKMKSFWVMPFRNNCLLTLTNFGKDTIFIRGQAGLTRYIWKPASMYFGSSWHEYYHVSTRDKQGNHSDLNFVDIKGKGMYVGDEISIFNPSYKWWGEGDEKIFVDGETFPSSFGTGTEDYYGYAFGRRAPFSHPFISQPVGNGNEGSPWGLTINLRNRSLDAIPFNSSINSNMELWHWADTKVNYALTSYWYVKYPFELNIKNDIQSVRNPVARSKDDFNRQEIKINAVP